MVTSILQINKPISYRFRTLKYNSTVKNYVCLLVDPITSIDQINEAKKGCNV